MLPGKIRQAHPSSAIELVHLLHYNADWGEESNVFELSTSP